MTTTHTQTAKNPAVIAKRLFKLERSGRYEQALTELADIWPAFEDDPNVSGFEPYASAEIFLRCGSLIGLLGHNAQIADAQLRSKDLLSAALERFIALDMPEKAAECENHLAFAFWRTGEFNEAENWIDEALARRLPDTSDARLYSYLINSLIDLSCKKFKRNVERGHKLEQTFLEFGDAFLIGSFYTNVGLSLKNLDRRAEALGHLELARHYHKLSGHKIYLGTVENNLAQLYKETGKFRQAHESIDSATRIFKRLKDRTREGYSLDTKALVYLAESKHADALRAVDKALAILEKSENSAYRIDTLLTKAKVLLHLSSFSSAVLLLFDAVEIARAQTGETSALRLIDEFEKELAQKDVPAAKAQPIDGDLELVLPASLAHYDHYQGVWINNQHLESAGLFRGSLAIVVKVNINRGDLVAISELENDQVICGFYDADFGIVCLETTEGEPQFFDEKNVRVLGKIVGVCKPDRNPEGKMVVNALTFPI